jgi:hypothetical protein
LLLLREILLVVVDRLVPADGRERLGDDPGVSLEQRTKAKTITLRQHGSN